jgi:aminoglycoside phosphotransferase (APT) family kinase protein
MGLAPARCFPTALLFAAGPVPVPIFHKLGVLEVLMSSQLDQPGPVRAGEELPVAQLEAYLAQHLPGVSGPLLIEQFSQGHSNLTYLLRLGTTELVLRRPPFGNKVKSAHDMGREFRVLSGLARLYAAAPRPLLYCAEEEVLGVPFYIMERRHGVILRKNLPKDLLFDSSTARRLGLAFIDNLVSLHALDFKAAGLGDLGKPEGYVARQVSGWIKRLGDAKTEDLPTLDRVAEWLTAHIPGDAGAALIHNDYKYDNLLLDPVDLTRISAVLDWEMATVGDPLMDLGSTLGYWVEASDPEALQHVATGPTYLPGSLTRRELMEHYQEKTGRQVANPLFYYCFGLFKLAVIIQQIYARFVRGHTRDPRFASLNHWVAVLAQQADRALEAGRI